MSSNKLMWQVELVHMSPTLAWHRVLAQGGVREDLNVVGNTP